jgi:DNA invertase Pin-like site-specific DNA recombinase
VTLGAQLCERGVGLHVIEQGIDTTSAEGRAMFGMLSPISPRARETSRESGRRECSNPAGIATGTPQHVWEWAFPDISPSN